MACVLALLAIHPALQFLDRKPAAFRGFGDVHPFFYSFFANQYLMATKTTDVIQSGARRNAV